MYARSFTDGKSNWAQNYKGAEDRMIYPTINEITPC